ATLRIGPEPEPTPTSAPTPTPRPRKLAIVLGDSINVRSGPGKEYDILGSADKGEELEARGVSSDQDWFLIYTPDLGEGWVSAPLVSLRVPVEELPVVRNP
ncbi:MAG TPA: SH3 domain-containing protein, partial [Anaerolineales bacterium]|nr:SH3 domain-containing protein [Anaerolineales bacterium]